MKTQHDFTFRSLAAFLGITFGLAWSILAAYMFLNPWATRWFGALSGSHPLFYLAVWAPAIATLFLVGRHAGWKGIRGLLSRFTLLRAPQGCILFVLTGIPVPFFIGAAILDHLGPGQWPPDTAASLLMASLLMLIKGPVEEIGWRGFALPLLQRHMRPLWAALVLGTIWGIWHYPAFLLSGTPQNAWNFSAFFFGTLALSVLVTALYNRSGGSLFWPVMFHFQLILPFWPDGQPLDTPVFVLFALAAVVMNRRALWDPAAAHTAVLPEAAS
jgi:membrane protease YdiL (CAAX protease family)